jgi:hypothetical protein
MLYPERHGLGKAEVTGQHPPRIALLATALAVTAAHATDPILPLDIMPGYWEITLTVRTSGLPPMAAEALAKLTPAERSRIDAKARERAAEGPKTTVKRSCLDEKELRQPLLLAFAGDGQGCRQTVIHASRTQQEIRVDCGDGAQHGGGTVRIEARNPENATVSSNWSATSGARTMKMSSTATLKWLGAVCEPDLPDVPQAGASKVTPPPEVSKSTAPATPKSMPPAIPRSMPPEAAAVPPGADAGYYYKLGKEQAGRDDLPGALRSLNRAIELDPQQSAAYNARGYVYLRMQNFANAIVDFSNAIRLRPDYANAYRNRAIARKHSGDDAGAAEDSRRAAELEHRR